MGLKFLGLTSATVAFVKAVGWTRLTEFASSDGLLVLGLATLALVALALTLYFAFATKAMTYNSDYRLLDPLRRRTEPPPSVEHEYT